MSGNDDYVDVMTSRLVLLTIHFICSFQFKLVGIFKPIIIWKNHNFVVLIKLIFVYNTITGYSPPQTPRSTLQSPSTKKKKVKSSKDDPGSSDEERWLKAIETGKLDEVDDELKKIKKKDPKTMTARQRAMFDRKSDNKEFIEELVALPSGMKY